MTSAVTNAVRFIMRSDRRKTADEMRRLRCDNLYQRCGVTNSLKLRRRRLIFATRSAVS